MPATFDATFIHWPSLDEFEAYLLGVPRPSWCKGITNHNTYIPNETQWRGLASMKSMMKTYIGNGWSAGPHLYCAAEAPYPDDRGIWQMTPLAHPGVHAGPCNRNRLGIEHVGDFDARPPTPAQYDLLLGVNRAILRAWGLAPIQVNVHRECMPGRTCPGRHLDPARLRADLRAAPPARQTVRYRFRFDQAVFTARDVAAPLAAGPVDGATVFRVGDEVPVGDVTDGWAWVATGIGFVPLAVLERV